jgi:hypothetical protein
MGRCRRPRLNYSLGPITIAIVLGFSSIENPAPATMDSSVNWAARALARSCSAMFSSGVEFLTLDITITPAWGANGIPAGGPYWETGNPGGGSRFQPAISRERLISLQISHASGTSDATIPKYCWPANSFIASAMRFRCSTEMDRGFLNFSNSNWASATRALASAILLSVCNLKRSNTSSAAEASRLCETIEPVVVIPIAIAANAAKTSDAISQKSHHSPLWPRNRVEAAAFALVMVSFIGGLTVAIFRYYGTNVARA